ncbi:MAG: hypothetical protein NT029_17450 [Armatimonadetes bacterium]|jgi:hypothetical protein|nr:hypothetical protein [Armatimonadota bacterium]
MIVIQGRGTISVTEPGHNRGTYYENAEISVYGDIVHFIAFNKHHTAASNMCLIGWDEPPAIQQIG